MSASDDDDSVGYGHPPKQNQFKRGQSGNPKGRPKGSRNLSAILGEELARKISVTIDGSRTRLTKAQIAMRQLVDQAVKGDPKAIQAVMRLVREVEQDTAGNQNHEGSVAPATELTDAQYADALAALLSPRAGEVRP